jgi:hypothetical protein
MGGGRWWHVRRRTVRRSWRTPGLPSYRLRDFCERRYDPRHFRDLQLPRPPHTTRTDQPCSPRSPPRSPAARCTAPDPLRSGAQHVIHRLVVGYVAEIITEDPDDRARVGARIAVHSGQHRRPRPRPPESGPAQHVLEVRHRWHRSPAARSLLNESRPPMLQRQAGSAASLIYASCRRGLRITVRVEPPTSRDSSRRSVRARRQRASALSLRNAIPRSEGWRLAVVRDRLAVPEGGAAAVAVDPFQAGGQVLRQVLPGGGFAG